LSPLHSPYTPFANHAHLFINYDNTFGDYADFSTNFAHNFDDYVNTPNDQANTITDLADMPTIVSLYHNFALLQ
jgi:hypothetical protein